MEYIFIHLFSITWTWVKYTVINIKMREFEVIFRDTGNMTPEIHSFLINVHPCGFRFPSSSSLSFLFPRKSLHILFMFPDLFCIPLYVHPEVPLTPVNFAIRNYSFNPQTDHINAILRWGLPQGSSTPDNYTLTLTPSNYFRDYVIITSSFSKNLVII